MIILIGGVGTLSGAIIGAAVFRLLEFFLDKWFGEAASFLLGVVYIAIVLFIPFAMAAARVRMPANLGEAFSMKFADFMKCQVKDGEDAECAQEAIDKIMGVLKGQHVSTTKRLAHTAV